VSLNNTNQNKNVSFATRNNNFQTGHNRLYIISKRILKTGYKAVTSSEVIKK